MMRPGWWVVVLVSGGLSLGSLATNWPERSYYQPREPERIRCELNGEIFIGSANADPYREENLGRPLIPTTNLSRIPVVVDDAPLQGALFPDEARVPYSDRILARNVFLWEACRLHVSTQLPLGIVYQHFASLRDAVSQPDFSSDHFLEEAQQQDVVADEAIQRDLDARRRHAQTEALIGGAVYFALPLVTLYAGARTLARVRRRFPSVTYSHLWIAAALVGAWLSFWWAAEDGRGDFTDGQWRLVGFTLLGLAGWRATRHSPRD